MAISAGRRRNLRFAQIVPSGERLWGTEPHVTVKVCSKVARTARCLLLFDLQVGHAADVQHLTQVEKGRCPGVGTLCLVAEKRTPSCTRSY